MPISTPDKSSSRYSASLSPAQRKGEGEWHSAVLRGDPHAHLALSPAMSKLPELMSSQSSMQRDSFLRTRLSRDHESDDSRLQHVADGSRRDIASTPRLQDQRSGDSLNGYGDHIARAGRSEAREKSERAHRAESPRRLSRQNNKLTSGWIKASSSSRKQEEHRDCQTTSSRPFPCRVCSSHLHPDQRSAKRSDSNSLDISQSKAPRQFPSSPDSNSSCSDQFALVSQSATAVATNGNHTDLHAAAVRQGGSEVTTSLASPLVFSSQRADQDETVGIATNHNDTVNQWTSCRALNDEAEENHIDDVGTFGQSRTPEVTPRVADGSVPSSESAAVSRSSSTVHQARRKRPLHLPPIMLPRIYTVKPTPLRLRDELYFMGASPRQRGPITQDEWEKLEDCRYLRIRTLSKSLRV